LVGNEKEMRERFKNENEIAIHIIREMNEKGEG